MQLQTEAPISLNDSQQPSAASLTSCSSLALSARKIRTSLSALAVAIKVPSGLQLVESTSEVASMSGSRCTSRGFAAASRGDTLPKLYATATSPNTNPAHPAAGLFLVLDVRKGVRFVIRRCEAVLPPIFATKEGRQL